MKLKLLLILLTISFAGLSACRSKRRAVRTDGEAVTLKLVVDGGDFSEESEEKKGRWVYLLSSCLPDTAGTYAGDNVVEFRSTGIKDGLAGCQVRVKTLDTGSIGQTIETPFESAVLYWKKDLVVKSQADGTYAITTGLDRTYQKKLSPGVDSFKVLVHVEAPEGTSLDGLKARLQCTPLVTELGTFNKSWFVFEVEYLAEISTLDCSYITVLTPDLGQSLYQAALGDTGKIATQSGGKVETAAVALKKYEGNGGTQDPDAPKPDEPKEDPPGNQDDEDVLVSTSEGECKEGETFDIESRSCKAL